MQAHTLFTEVQHTCQRKPKVVSATRGRLHPLPTYYPQAYVSQGPNTGRDLLICMGTFQVHLCTVTRLRMWWGPGHRQHCSLLRAALPGCSWCSSATPDTQQGDLDRKRKHVQFIAELMHQPLCHAGVSEVCRGGHTQPQEEEASIWAWGNACPPCPSRGGQGC